MIGSNVSDGLNALAKAEGRLFRPFRFSALLGEHGLSKLWLRDG